MLFRRTTSTLAPRRRARPTAKALRARRSQSTTAAAASPSSSSSPPAPDSPSSPAYPYQSPEGRNKATIEHIFTPDSDDSDVENDNDNDNDATAVARDVSRAHRRSALGGASASASAAPWGIGWQMSERNLVWNDDLKLRLIKRVAAQKLQISEDELERRLELLVPLLPRSLAPLLSRASADTAAGRGPRRRRRRAREPRVWCAGRQRPSGPPARVHRPLRRGLSRGAQRARARV